MNESDLWWMFRYYNMRQIAIVMSWLPVLCTIVFSLFYIGWNGHPPRRSGCEFDFNKSSGPMGFMASCSFLLSLLCALAFVLGPSELEVYSLIALKASNSELAIALMEKAMEYLGKQ